MSELRVALVAEGPTDKIVIEAALKAMLPQPFLLNQLQPEATCPKLGTGWGGVLRKCLEFASRGHVRLEDDPILPGYDLIVLHVDADVAESKYEEVSQDIAEAARAREWPKLPCNLPCPPPDRSAGEMRDRLLKWAGLAAPGPKTVLCVPSKSTDAWLASAVLAAGHKLLKDLECNLNLEANLRALPKAQRIKKTTRDYHRCAEEITKGWSIVRSQCSQAELFSNDVLAVFG